MMKTNYIKIKYIMTHKLKLNSLMQRLKLKLQTHILKLDTPINRLNTTNSHIH